MKNFIKIISLVLFIHAACALHAAAPVNNEALIIAAVKANDTTNVGILLALGVSPNTVDEKGNPLLSIAIKNNRLPVFELLLHNPNINVNKPNNHGNTPLMIAIQEESDMDLSKSTRLAQNNFTQKLLAERRVNVNRQNTQTGYTALMVAAQYGNWPVAQELYYASHANANTTNHKGHTAAYIAKENGFDAIAKDIYAWEDDVMPPELPPAPPLPKSMQKKLQEQPAPEAPTTSVPQPSNPDARERRILPAPPVHTLPHPPARTVPARPPKAPQTRSITQ